jgi:hypothetical protein
VCCVLKNNFIFPIAVFFLLSLLRWEHLHVVADMEDHSNYLYHFNVNLKCPINVAFCEPGEKHTLAV